MFLKRWLFNLYVIVWGSFLSLLGCGGYERVVECPDCGATIEYTDAAMRWHDQVCPAQDEGAA
jgi:hypothetical protein